tara:strand:- start:98 stop:1315 length:1218 start_codon:yes stop_codon:yes gene_type:complete
MNKRYIKKIIFGILCSPVYIVCSFIKRDRHIWVFGSWYGKTYSDNSAYLFEFVNSYKKNIKAIWITKNRKVISLLKGKGYQVYHAYSIFGLWYGSRAGVTIINCGYDDVNKYCIVKSFIVQLWHGIPIKKIKKDDKLNNIESQNNFLKLIKFHTIKIFPFLSEHYDVIISSSKIVTEKLETAFSGCFNKIFETGYPRMDIISSKNEINIDRLIKRERYGGKLILYAPTHRQEGKTEINILQRNDIYTINDFLIKSNALMLIKSHEYEKQKNWESKIKGLDNIIFLDQTIDIDVNMLLPYIDILITDYSSIFYDFIILDKPIIFFPFDITHYNQVDRKFYGNYNKQTPGVKCYNWSDIIIEIKKIFSGQDSFVLERQIIVEETYKYKDIYNCSRIVDLIKKELVYN